MISNLSTESSPKYLNVDYEWLQENYGIDDNLDDIQSPDNLETSPATPGNASQTQNIRGGGRGNTGRPPLPIKRNQKLRSKCWNFFERLEEEKNYVRCQICKEVYKHETGGKQGGTCQLRRHVVET